MAKTAAQYREDAKKLMEKARLQEEKETLELGKKARLFIDSGYKDLESFKASAKQIMEGVE